jgi:hypothetical protein
MALSQITPIPIAINPALKPAELHHVALEFLTARMDAATAGTLVSDAYFLLALELVGSQRFSIPCDTSHTSNPHS